MAELEQLPFDLDYPDPAPRSFNLGNLRERGRRRRQRRVGALAASAVLLVTATTILTVVGGTGTRSGGDGGLGGDTLLSTYPPVAGPVTLPEVVPGWTTRAWVARNGVYCDVSSLRGEPGSLSSHCDSDNLDDPAPGGTTIGFPLAAAAPFKDGYGTIITWVQGPAAALQITLDGTTTSAPLTAVSTTDGQVVGVAVALVPLHGLHSWASSDITQLVAIDTTGRKVATWRHPTAKPSTRP
ncbi:MAG: hypothetical protein QOJ11_1431 [Frankiales bacterium]|jgi:hypothetical protein|nr:hypothetical protein [Frankiales bacterium]